MAGAQNQYSATSYFGGALQPQDAFSRIMAMRYGGRTDRIFDFVEEPGYRVSMGPASYGSSSTSGDPSQRFIGSGMAQTGFSGGSTSNDPGGYNWDTLQRNMGRASTAAQSLVAFRMENKRLSIAKQRKQDDDWRANASNQLGNVYGAGQDPYTQAFATAQQKSAQGQAAQKIQGIKNLASQVVPPSQNLTASKQASSNTMVAGASRPIGGRKTQPVNLLYPNGLPKKGSRKPSKNSPYAGPQPPAPPTI
jgi:hypothetical protein